MRILWRVLAALVLVAAILGLGAFAYNLGVHQALGTNVPAVRGVPFPMHTLRFGHPFMGFGLLGCILPLFLLFLVFGAFRALMWHGPMGWGHMHRRRWGWHDENDKGVPPFFEEWHRRAHGQPEKPEEPKKE